MLTCFGGSCWVFGLHLASSPTLSSPDRATLIAKVNDPNLGPRILRSGSEAFGGLREN